MRKRSLKTRERSLLLALLRPECSRSKLVLKEELSLQKWEKILLTAEFFAVKPTIAHTICNWSKPLELPEEILNQAREILAEETARNGLLLMDLISLSGALESAGIPFIVLKGTVLIIVYYETPGARHLDDIDLLVREEDLDRAEEVLKGLGYHYAVEGEMISVDGRKIKDFVRPRLHSLSPLVSPSGTLVDTHWAVPGHQTSSTAEFDILLGRSERVEFMGTEITVPGYSDLVSHLCEHVVEHHNMLPKYLPRHMADLWQLTRGEGALSLDRLRHQDVTLTRPVKRSIFISRVLFEASFGENAEKEVLLRLLRRLLFANSLVVLIAKQRDHLIRMVARIRFDLRHQPSMLWYKLFPARAYMADWYGVKENSPWIFPLYLYRLVKLPFEPFKERLP